MDTRVDLSQNKREILVDTIIEYSGDEFEWNKSYIELAKKSEQELFHNIQNIRDYFYSDIDDEDYSDDDDNYKEQLNELNYIIEYILTI